MKRDLYLVVESVSDYEFWDKQIKEHFPYVRVKVHNLRNENPADEFDHIVEDAAEGGYERVVFLVDEDASPRQESKVEAVKNKHRELEQRAPAVAKRVMCFGVRRCLEAWLLADEGAIRTAFSKTQYRRKTLTDNLANPKREARAVCERHYGRNHTWSEVQFARQMACKVDFQRAVKWSLSLRVFWQQVGPYFRKSSKVEQT